MNTKTSSGQSKREFGMFIELVICDDCLQFIMENAENENMTKQMLVTSIALECHATITNTKCLPEKKLQIFVYKRWI
jgi:hypothetical protein